MAQSRDARERARIRNEIRKIKRLSRGVPNQDRLNSILLDVPSRIMRREVYELIRPYLKFEAEYPEWLSNHHRVEFERYDQSLTQLPEPPKSRI